MEEAGLERPLLAMGLSAQYSLDERRRLSPVHPARELQRLLPKLGATRFDARDELALRLRISRKHGDPAFERGQVKVFSEAVGNPSGALRELLQPAGISAGDYVERLLEVFHLLARLVQRAARAFCARSFQSLAPLAVHPLEAGAQNRRVVAR